ncbi:hypothetical protein LRS06_02455 [Hymenobacter sp. J193]|uniref:hypothetical protein n=1 Tax=Hymenobacter sp. J193 TaxID=2898429 RepID=UPI0021518644|nr:hypothetical protein [Hymenobacter sp. J193]MCR5886653.1 hypothetical protein [Hymenobacter sp. J193]
MKIDNRYYYKDYWQFYNDNKSEMMYGSLYFQDMSQNVSTATEQQQESYTVGPNIKRGSVTVAKAMPFSYYRDYGTNGTVEREVGADLYQPTTSYDYSYFSASLRPLSIAHDDFSVMGDNISGPIRPQRLDVGSLAVPRVMADKHDKYSLIPFLDYKVGFRYENSISNSYDYHQPTDAAGNGLLTTGIGTEVPSNSLVLTDQKLFADYPGTRTAPARKGIINDVFNRVLAQSKHVQWYSNDEIMSLYTANPEGDGSKFLEFYKPAAQSINTQVITGYGEWICPNGNRDECYKEPIYGTQTTAPTPNPWRITKPGKGIGAFAITAEDGTTYHYSLPVYHFATYSESRELSSPSTEGVGVATTQLGEKGSTQGYATTWLLTAITSPDYVDRGQIGTVDKDDWGGWVRFDYGKFASQYKWRQPYVGKSYRPDDMNTVSYSEGYKETYYLNSIRTRTYTALFVKSVRKDGRGHFTPGGSTTLGITETTPSSSLRLDEIILLDNDDWNKLKTVNGIRQPSDGSITIPALTNDTQTNSQTYDPAELVKQNTQDTYKEVLDIHDLDVSSSIRAYVNKRALKRIQFNYSYRLCPGTPSSFPSLTQLPSMDPAQASVGRTGKLTLESLSVFGPQNAKLIPDIKFKYDNNPAYSPEKYDYFGMYASGGMATATTNNHQVAVNGTQAAADGAAWSMTEVINPLGGSTKFQYERDQYSQISEFGTRAISFSNNDCGTLLTVRTAAPNGFTSGNGFTGDLRDYFKVNQPIAINGVATFQPNCYLDGFMTKQPICKDHYSNRATTITAVTATTITIADPPDNTLCSESDGFDYCELTPLGMSASVEVAANRYGGDIRIAAITTTDENATAYQVRYRYTRDDLPGKTATGVLAKEPQFVAGYIPRAFENQYDYPNTPVLYSKVTVLRGPFKNNSDSDYNQREEYSFHTPQSTMLSQSPAFNSSQSTQILNNGLKVESQYNKVVVDMGKIGQPISVKKSNKRGEVELATTFSYSSAVPNADGIGNQGTFTEGTMTTEMLERTNYRINRTTKHYLPTIMASSVSIANGIRSENTNAQYDFLSGQVLETVSKDALGTTFRTKTVPAYLITPFQTMGLKALDPTNKNMLAQAGAEYVYKEVAGRQTLVAAQVTTWKNDWATYREYDAATDGYTDKADAANPIWRQHENYLWQGKLLNADGTYAAFQDFNWNQLLPAGQAAGWLRTSQTVRYDHYSHALEQLDLNGFYSSTKNERQHTQPLASVSNAKYGEFAFSSAETTEPLPSNSIHFSGEVRDGHTRYRGLTATGAYLAHTGEYSIKLDPSNRTGFTYRAKVGDANDIRANRKYKVSVWLNSQNASDGRLYATLNGVAVTEGEAAIGSATTRKAGDWYLLTLIFSLPTSANSQTLQVGCKNVGASTIYFDDFRLQPAQSAMSASVYDEHTRQLTYQLDNNNLFTHYKYDAAGKVVQTLAEVFYRPGGEVGGEKLLAERSYNYARMREPNWLETGTTRCMTANGTYTGEKQKEEKDINPSSTTYAQTRWVSLGNTGCL